MLHNHLLSLTIHLSGHPGKVRLMGFPGGENTTSLDLGNHGEPQNFGSLFFFPILQQKKSRLRADMLGNKLNSKQTGLHRLVVW